MSRVNAQFLKNIPCGFKRKTDLTGKHQLEGGSLWLSFETRD